MQAAFYTDRQARVSGGDDDDQLGTVRPVGELRLEIIAKPAR